MFTRKSALSIALILFALLAMLVPAAYAAPEYLHGVEITSPTEDNPVLVSHNPDAAVDAKFDVEFTFNIVNTQEYDVLAKAWLVDEYGNKVPAPDFKLEIDVNDIETGDNDAKIQITVPNGVVEGWYHVLVCVKEELGDFDELTPKWCAEVEDAVLVDETEPDAWLDKPGGDPMFDAVWVTGKDYLLVGGAKDNFGVDRVWFEYHASPFTGWDWIQIPTDTDAVGTGVPNEYKAMWDSTLVRDDYALIRICATDIVGLTTCSKSQRVFVENRYTISLRPGWNLISAPLMLYNPDIEAVLDHLIAHGTVEAVVETKNGGGTWSSWVNNGPQGIANIEHGQGYWIKMKGEDELTFTGTWKAVGPWAPPEYAVRVGWNLIGYTHWGTPTHPLFGDKTVLDYLGLPLAPAMEALWRYDASTEIYVPMWQGDDMVKGAGYWLAAAQGGTINP